MEASDFLHLTVPWTCPWWAGGLDLHLAFVSCHFLLYFKFVFCGDAYKLLMVDSFIASIEISLGNDYYSEMSSRRSWLLAFETGPNPTFSIY